MRNFIAVFASLGVLGLVVVLMLLGRGCEVADKVSDSDNIVYQNAEFERLYEQIKTTCVTIDNLRAMPEKNQPTGFSKDERVFALEAKLQSMIGQYNSKARALESKYWRSSSLPKQLSIDNPCVSISNHSS